MDAEKQTKLLKILLLVSALVLCLAVLPMWPGVFYILLRIVVCASAAYVGYTLWSDELLNSHAIPLMLLAILFNPIVPLYLTPWIWIPIYLGVALYFLSLSKKIK